MLEREEKEAKRQRKRGIERVLLVAYVDNNVYAKGISRLMFPMKYYRERGVEAERERERDRERATVLHQQFNSCEVYKWPKCSIKGQKINKKANTEK